MTAGRPTLSICVPTRNRLGHLARSLERLFAPGAFPFPIEVVLSDNASTDDTPALAQQTIARGLPLRYQRHETDIGPHANIFSAFRRASGTFALYLADDDGLDAANLTAALAWLDAHPECVASYGPIHTFDAVDNVSQGLTYGIEQDVAFDRQHRLDLARFLAGTRIIPEVAIMRTAALADTLFMTHTIYWPFALLDRLIQIGSVQFRAKPHYVSLRRQWLGDEARITACLRFGLEEWESCLRGLRFLYDAALVAGERPTSEADRATIEHDVRAFGDYFRNQAIYTVARTGRLSEALDIIKLLSGQQTLVVGDPALAPLAAAGTAAALHAVLEVFDHAGPGTTLVLYGFGGHAATLAGAFATVRPALPVATAEPGAPVPDPQRTLVLVPDDATRRALVAAGLLPARVVWLGGVMAHFDVTRWLDYARGA